MTQAEAQNAAQSLAFLLPQPGFELPSAKQAEFEALLDRTPAGGFVDYQLAYPRWQFLSYLCQSRELVLHGSQNLEIDQVEPRQALDVKEFSKQQAIYATTDGIWVLYFAILDRKRYPEITLFNSCIQIRIGSDRLSEPLYFFSITQSVLQQKPWCQGLIYILPRVNFVREAAQSIYGAEIIFPHWISTQAAQPVAKLLVGPEDFPFIDKIHGHHNEKLVQLMTANPNGFPWPDALES